MHFVVTGGGTGGHIYPALAIARGLLAKYPGAQVLYIGRAGGLEADLVPKANLPFRSIPVTGLKRNLSPRNLLVFWQAARGVLLARQILADFKPRVVVGTGGYVCGPVVMAAVLLGIPTLIHEQNALPGLTNRLLSRLVSQVALTFDDARKYFPRKARVKVTGLPVRPEVLAWRRDEARRAMGIPEDAQLVLSFGGSQGARAINLAMIEVLKQFGGREGVYFLHVTGPGQYEEFCARAREAGLSIAENGNIILVPYLDEMPRALAAADLAICRAGAATLAELTVVGLPAILIPYPYAAGNHQEYNARSLEKEGAALVIRDRELTGSLLAEKLARLLARPAKLKAMARASRRLGRSRALDEILELIDNLVR
ncbi:UDP-N-acetylglucosamine--N-acetylmuramyl-(pentapeptide) pyrophosphoryl-undecaprenol N-acetylglucosamine transferase [Desulfofundulus luciae]|uniref:UDP-N-acetylglucosamine--N-acetylmuramyl-(pentapeptide) pyrophosphoryl-undecaprenol N-acetylglucosamine transferase n=1 Tax=Desulfofundulus luciae TaxID=74702 RepID=A0ABU0B4U3_9FIRM|nr:undecaprenyldiphospho-muramoylpentapeptide beta-N-acetylglucosaminyltransferase [Desulfofundulus luciae]MDQ0286971.1 UDP-N-acetylglucosamine--N-acetylmuramyl-(pentapeptide) pyrophosphoryl-undecaprenol N-acetylglucosamine transferase [Desulfofundulus luciae]